MKHTLQNLTKDVPALHAEILRMQDVIASYERGKAERQAQELKTRSGPIADLEIDVFNAKASLEGLADGSEDFTDSIVRGSICREAVAVLDKSLQAVKDSQA